MSHRMPYRTGNRNARNIYRYSFAGEQDEHVGVMFTPDDGHVAVEALNLWHKMMEDAAEDRQPTTHKYRINAHGPRHNGGVTPGEAWDFCQTYSVYAPDEADAARTFHRRYPGHTIHDMWQLVPPGYLASQSTVAGEEGSPRVDTCAESKAEVPW